ncbi:substrate-binding domain-containing protein [Streptomyces sp. RTd22]|uniref:substrate-binding domain-containing protein n=1 Tax=Streptomyces sp. RTd22 TaxID=1841249 RepID=UPI000A7EA45F|nr:substrate-binding domain-containing protein [Streptomyces sp. RTd22]
MDGIVLVSPHLSGEELRSLDELAAKPTVLLHRREPGFASVTADLMAGMTDAVAHLHALGHRKIAYLGGPRSSWTARERAAGVEAMAESGQVEIVHVGSVAPQFDGGVTGAADVVLASGASAVVAFNDIVAFGLISRFTARGVRVPAEMSVVGCDDFVLSGMAAPPLTTVSAPKAYAARAAVDLLSRILGTPAVEGAEPMQRVLETHLVVRGSTPRGGVTSALRYQRGAPDRSPGPRSSCRACRAGARGPGPDRSRAAGRVRRGPARPRDRGPVGPLRIRRRRPGHRAPPGRPRHSTGSGCRTRRPGPRWQRRRGASPRG